MNSFLAKIEQNLSQFSQFEAEQAVVFGTFFTKNEAKISFFIDEIRQTATLLSQQTQLEYAEIYSKRLLDQIDALQKAVKKIKQQNKTERFYPTQRFSRNIHSLPEHKRMIEYHRALRALNEKISWLLDKQFQARNEMEAEYYQQKIQETEFRKQRCLEAIENIDGKM